MGINDSNEISPIRVKTCPLRKQLHSVKNTNQIKYKKRDKNDDLPEEVV